MTSEPVAPTDVALDDTGLPGWTDDQCWDHYPNHPTMFVRTCSPDRVLSRDGQTSRACRSCGCGRCGTHVTGCTAGKGPPRKATTEETACLLVDAALDELITKHGVPAANLIQARHWNYARWPWERVSMVDFRDGNRPPLPDRPDLVQQS